MTDQKFEVDEEFAFLGRTFAEYRRMFDLSVESVRGKRVLDCPGGPGPFTAVANEIGASVTAVDPVYGPPADELESLCRRSVDENVAQLREKADLFVWDEYGDPETRGRYQRAAAERFLADYAANPDRYVAAGLPDLPFADDTFELTLSGNLCFLYDDRLDERFHVDAMRELLRVTAGEVRVFPLASLDRTRSAYVERVVERLRADGYVAQLREVSYEFQPGATEMLVVDA
jgi:SAM-dependent methyltransferase